MGRHRLAAAALCLALTVGGCATVPVSSSAPSPADPWERWNRRVFVFNEAVDEAVLKPVAETYRDVVPKLVRTGVDNVLGNFGDFWSTANHFMQGKGQDGLEMGMRVLTNTVFGLGGLLDPATEIGLTRRSEDFGQTLGKWGLPQGPYFVLPLLGPSTVRDTAGLLVDRQASPATLPSTATDRYAVTALQLLSVRTNLLSAVTLVDQVALDKYSFIRDGYLSRRRDALYDGAPPMEAFDYEADSPPPPVPKPAASAPR
ncbi:MAG: ABC transporter [Leptothrix sp. (in: Bacteria)]|nr:ABC transporter [Leptothrix sp. (in: b-proteobacteria)]